MSAASRTVQTTPRVGQLGIAVAAILLAAALAVALLAVAQPTAPNQQAGPAAGSAPTLHDRGLATAGSEGAPATAPILHDRGSSTAATEAATTPTFVGVPISPPARDANSPAGPRRHR